ncbi:MAG TPA: hypothetical protein VFF72_09720 [Caldimonas sp.]|nr:hypothetical protein [Caldimonas sp.]
MDATLSGAAAASDPTLRPGSPWPMFWIASVAIFLVSLDGTMLYSVFGALRAGFPGASAADMSWVLQRGDAASLTFGIAFAMMFFAFFFYMGNVWHYSPARAELAIAPGPLTVIPAAMLTGRFAARFGHRHEGGHCPIARSTTSARIAKGAAGLRRRSDRLDEQTRFAELPTT